MRGKEENVDEEGKKEEDGEENWSGGKKGMVIQKVVEGKKMKKDEDK